MCLSTYEGFSRKARLYSFLYRFGIAINLKEPTTCLHNPMNLSHTHQEEMPYQISRDASNHSTRAFHNDCIFFSCVTTSRHEPQSIQNTSHTLHKRCWPKLPWEEPYDFYAGVKVYIGGGDEEYDCEDDDTCKHDECEDNECEHEDW